jgi:hypothetical protein
VRLYPAHLDPVAAPVDCAYFGSVAFTPEGTELSCVIYQDGPTSSLLIDIDSGKVISRTTPEALRFSPDGYLLTAEQFSSLSVRSRDGKVAIHLGDGYDPCFAPDGRTTMDVWENIDAVFTPDGRRLIFLDKPGRPLDYIP